MQKVITPAQFTEITATTTATTDGGNFCVTGGKNYYSIDAFEFADCTVKFVVDHQRVTEDNDWVFFFDAHSNLKQFTLIEIWEFDDASEAALFYAKKISEDVLNQMLTGV